jgi:hypothetical protein
VTSAADAYRAYAIQERIFRQRYTPNGPTAVDGAGKAWQGQRWYRLPIYAAAATPGTSNHGWGVACDITGLASFTGTRYRQLASVAAAHGWDNNEGASINEAWHWVYKPTADRVSKTITAPGVNIPNPGGTLPADLTPEDDMPYTEDQLLGLMTKAVTAVAKSEGISGAGDIRRLAEGLDYTMRQAVRQETTDVLRTEGVSGAGDLGRLTDALRPILAAQALGVNADAIVDELTARLSKGA